MWPYVKAPWLAPMLAMTLYTSVKAPLPVRRGANQVVGAFIIGICENLIKGLDVILIKSGVTKQMLGLTTFSDAFTFALLIIILIVKPTGLFGEKTTDKV